MKFIKTIHGDYVNVEALNVVTVSKHANVYDVMAYTQGPCAYFARFDTEAQARAYLDKFIAELNAEDNK